MAESGMVSRNQERFLQALLLGQSIVDAAKSAGISERTAHRWVKDPLVQAERERRETILREAEQAEIQRILTSGYAAMHRRVEALDKLAKKLEDYMEDEQNIWLPDVKSVGSGPMAERVDLVTFNDALISEYRATFADIAAELGQRVKVSKSDITSAGEKLEGHRTVFVLPEVDKDEVESGSTDETA